MANTSTWFKGNARLNQCLISDPAHVQKGDSGDYVMLIQGALMALDNVLISVDEQSQKLYGPSTAQAVLAYKRKRQIINPSYQTQADDIVGRMTMLALDTEMGALERRQFHLIFALGITEPITPKSAIVSESNKIFRGWAKQSENAFKPNMLVFDVPSKSSAEASVGVIKQAIAAASGGLLVLSVGHGVCLDQGFTDEGAFDAAPDGVMRITGKNFEKDPKQFVNVFYDDKPSANSGLKPLSDKDKDERNPTDPSAKKRLKNWALYDDLSKSFATGKVTAVILLTCRVGKAAGFLTKVATQWKTPIIAYTDQVAGQEMVSGRMRVFLAQDKGKEISANPGTNNAFGEVMFPLSIKDMVRFNPKP